MKELVELVVGVPMIIYSVIRGIVINFTNPDMTEMRLLITYWQEYLFLFILIVIGYFLIQNALDL